jgi:hypothetical protein
MGSSVTMSKSEPRFAEKERTLLQADQDPTQEEPPRELSKEEKKKRNALVNKYGYDVDDMVENEHGNHRRASVE